MSERISVEDKLPEEADNFMGSGFSVNVLVVDSGGDMDICRYMYPWRNMDLLGFSLDKGSVVNKDDVTHWMPLPEPPK